MGLVYRSGEDDVVDRDEHKFDEVADGAHDQETDDASLQDLHVLGLVWLLALFDEHHGVLGESRHLVCEAGFLLLLFLGHLCCCCRLNTTNYSLFIR